MLEFGGTDESIDFGLGMLGIKSELALGYKGSTHSGMALLRSAFEKYVQEIIKANDERMEFLSNDKYAPKDRTYAPQNKKVICSIINDMLSSLGSAGFQKSVRVIVEKSRQAVDAKKQQQFESGAK